MNPNAKRQFMVIRDVGQEDRIVAMNLTLEEAMARSRDSEFYGVGNMFNWFKNHKCPVEGCEICELLNNIE
jgi:hypothetical protein